MTEWHDDDAFWETFRPIMFPPERWTRVPGEVDGIVELLELEPPLDVLDLCCGPGRHSLELARRGHRVTGVDRTASFLSSAREQASDEGLAVDFVEGDMRDFRREQAFDVALSLFTSFGYFDDPADNQRVLENLHASLRPGGQLLVDVMGKEVLARIFDPSQVRELDDGTLLIEQRRLEDDWRRIRNTWTVVSREGSRRDFELSHWLYSAAELAGMVENAGFVNVECFGGFDGSAYDQRAGRLVVVGQRS